MIKFLQSNPTVLADGGSLTAESFSFPPIARLVSTVAGIVLSMAGIGLGILSFIFDFNRPGLTAAVLILQIVLSSFVFCIEVFAVPIFNYERMTGPPAPRPNGWSESESEAAFAFGTFFCLFSYCSTSLGMICSAALELRKAQLNLNENLASATMRLRTLSAAVMLFGLGCLVLGSMIVHRELPVSRLVSTPYVYPPNFVEFPAILVMTGLFIMIYAAPGLVGIPPLAKIQAFLAVPMWMWMVCVHILTQVAHFPPEMAFLGGLLGIMSLANILAPAVYGARVLFLKRA